MEQSQPTVKRPLPAPGELATREEVEEVLGFKLRPNWIIERMPDMEKIKEAMRSIASIDVDKLREEIKQNERNNIKPKSNR